MMGQFCGGCGSNVAQPGAAVLHPRLDAAHVLCGNTGKRVLTYAREDEVPRPDVQPTAAQREFEVIAAALTYHEAHHDTPVEVLTEGGWLDMIDLLEPLRNALFP